MIRRSRHLGLVSVLLLVVAGMTGLAFASAPLYRLFCQVTGFGGTTQRADSAPSAISARVITVRFEATTSDQLPWRFHPVERAVQLRVGEQGLAFYRAINVSGATTSGSATFNVTPQKAGPYFAKIECFCFQEQVLKPGEQVEMPVSFFVDPAILSDRNLDEVKTITLSYTMFRAHAPAPAGQSNDQPNNQPRPVAAAAPRQ